MIRIALTGSIGMGKSTVARMFGNAGIPVFDADAEVRRLQAPGGALVKEIGARFPGTVEGNVLDRDRLAARVVDDPTALANLEAIVHPAVRAARERFVADNRGAPALIFEIPLLFETGADSEFDKIIVVSAPVETQQARVLSRTGMSRGKLDALIARQLPDEEKRRRANFVIDTGGDLSTTQDQVRHIMACLGLAAGG
jgi:dephospho-CoA kinase